MPPTVDWTLGGFFRIIKTIRLSDQPSGRQLRRKAECLNCGVVILARERTHLTRHPCYVREEGYAEKSTDADAATANTSSRITQQPRIHVSKHSPAARTSPSTSRQSNSVKKLLGYLPARKFSIITFKNYNSPRGIIQVPRVKCLICGVEFNTDGPKRVKNHLRSLAHIKALSQKSASPRKAPIPTATPSTSAPPNPTTTPSTNRKKRWLPDCFRVIKYGPGFAECECVVCGGELRATAGSTRRHLKSYLHGDALFFMAHGHPIKEEPADEHLEAEEPDDAERGPIPGWVPVRVVQICNRQPRPLLECRLCGHNFPAGDLHDVSMHCLTKRHRAAADEKIRQLGDGTAELENPVTVEEVSDEFNETAPELEISAERSEVAAKTPSWLQTDVFRIAEHKRLCSGKIRHQLECLLCGVNIPTSKHSVSAHQGSNMHQDAVFLAACPPDECLPMKVEQIDDNFEAEGSEITESFIPLPSVGDRNIPTKIYRIGGSDQTLLLECRLCGENLVNATTDKAFRHFLSHRHRETVDEKKRRIGSQPNDGMAEPPEVAEQMEVDRQPTQRWDPSFSQSPPTQSPPTESSSAAEQIQEDRKPITISTPFLKRRLCRNLGSLVEWSDPSFTQSPRTHRNSVPQPFQPNPHKRLDSSFGSLLIQSYFVALPQTGQLQCLLCRLVLSDEHQTVDSHFRLQHSQQYAAFSALFKGQASARENIREQSQPSPPDEPMHHSDSQIREHKEVEIIDLSQSRIESDSAHSMDVDIIDEVISLPVSDSPEPQPKTTQTEKRYSLSSCSTITEAPSSNASTSMSYKVEFIDWSRSKHPPKAFLNRSVH